MRRANSEAFAPIGKGLSGQQHTTVAMMETVSSRETVFQGRSKLRARKQFVSIPP